MSRSCVRSNAACFTAFVVWSLAAGCGGESVSIVRDGNVVADFSVDIATTAEERVRGLRGRDSLCDSCGLLIEFPRATEACIVNSGVVFAIDVIYISDALRVSALERGIAADDATSRCHPDVRYVLEVSAGAAADVLADDEIER